MRSPPRPTTLRLRAPLEDALLVQLATTERRLARAQQANAALRFQTDDLLRRNRLLDEALRHARDESRHRIDEIWTARRAEARMARLLRYWRVWRWLCRWGAP